MTNKATIMCNIEKKYSLSRRDITILAVKRTGTIASDFHLFSEVGQEGNISLVRSRQTSFVNIRH